MRLVGLWSKPRMIVYWGIHPTVCRSSGKELKLLEIVGYVYVVNAGIWIAFNLHRIIWLEVSWGVAMAAWSYLVTIFDLNSLCFMYAHSWNTKKLRFGTTGSTVKYTAAKCMLTGEDYDMQCYLITIVLARYRTRFAAPIITLESGILNRCQGILLCSVQLYYFSATVLVTGKVSL